MIDISHHIQRNISINFNNLSTPDKLRRLITVLITSSAFSSVIFHENKKARSNEQAN